MACLPLLSRLQVNIMLDGDLVTSDHEGPETQFWVEEGRHVRLEKIYLALIHRSPTFAFEIVGSAGNVGRQWIFTLVL